MKSKRFWTTFFLIFDAWNTIYDCESSRMLSSWWRHQMETLSALLVLCVGNSPVTGEFPSQKPLTRSFDIFFDLRLKNRWVNKRGAGDLRRHRAHYDVIVMFRLMDGNTLRPGRNKRHFAYDVFKCIFLDENIWILMKISLKFIPKGPINNIPAWIQIMACHATSHYMNQW